MFVGETKANSPTQSSANVSKPLFNYFFIFVSWQRVSGSNSFIISQPCFSTVFFFFLKREQARDCQSESRSERESVFEWVSKRQNAPEPAERRKEDTERERARRREWDASPLQKMIIIFKKQTNPLQKVSKMSLNTFISVCFCVCVCIHSDQSVAKNQQ